MGTGFVLKGLKKKKDYWKEVFRCTTSFPQNLFFLFASEENRDNKSTGENPNGEVA